MTISVAVADDQALVRAGFCGIIAATPGLRVAGEAANGAEAVQVAWATRPDIVLMDVRMPVLDGIGATSQITASPGIAGVRVIILTTFDLDEYVFGALRAGASGFLLKDTPPAGLLTAIKVVAAGDALLTPSITRRLINAFALTPAQPRDPAVPGLAAATASRADQITRALTGREREVLGLVAAGLSNAEIARRLFISHATAKTHVGHLLTKLGARDRVQLVIIAYQAGIAPET
jgi:DNA-binding NarL/FixJ family response regulator